jgi:hypothetical protein
VSNIPDIPAPALFFKSPDLTLDLDCTDVTDGADLWEGARAVPAAMELSNLARQSPWGYASTYKSTPMLRTAGGFDKAEIETKEGIFDLLF